MNQMIQFCCCDGTPNAVTVAVRRRCAMLFDIVADVCVAVIALGDVEAAVVRLPSVLCDVSAVIFELPSGEGGYR